MRKAVLGSCCVVLIGIIGFSFWWFTVENGQSLSSDMALWGSYGSFLAGSIGVTFGLATVWMLAETLKIQRDELAATRDELKRTREAQESASENMRLQYEILLADYKRRNFASYVNSLTTPIDNALSASKVLKDRHVTVAVALKYKDYIGSFESELAIIVWQFCEIGRTLRSTEIDIEDHITLTHSVSRFYHLYSSCRGAGLFDGFKKDIVHVLDRFYESVRGEVKVE